MATLDRHGNRLWRRGNVYQFTSTAKTTPMSKKRGSRNGAVNKALGKEAAQKMMQDSVTAPCGRAPNSASAAGPRRQSSAGPEAYAKLIGESASFFAHHRRAHSPGHVPEFEALF